jgi:hypothetical protein
MVTRDEIEGQSALGAGYNLVMNLHGKSGHRVPHEWTKPFNVNKIIGRSILAFASDRSNSRIHGGRSKRIRPLGTSIGFPLKADRP